MNLLHQDAKHGTIEVVDASDEDISSPSTNSGSSRPPPRGSRRLSNECMWMSNSLGAPRGLFIPLGSLHEIFLEREANLVSIKPASPRFSCFATLPCDLISPAPRLQIMQFWYLNCVARNYLNFGIHWFHWKWIRSQKWPRKIICLCLHRSLYARAGTSLFFLTIRVRFSDCSRRVEMDG
jgi:hypothetical protein